MSKDIEKQIRDRVQSLKRFYLDLTIYVAFNIGIILIWAVSGGGYFWPIWVMVGWGLGLVFRCVALGMFPAAHEVLPFLAPEWEEKQVKKLLKDKKDVSKG